MALLIVLALRLIVPISIFRWPLVGGVIAMLLDGADVILVDILNSFLGESIGYQFDYHSLDKWLDFYYLSFEFIVSLKWINRFARNTSVALFVFRTIGFVLFEVTGIRKILFFFPNLFENFFLYYLAAKRFFPKLIPRTLIQLAVVLAILYIPKFAQEWILHYKELQPWRWFKGRFL